MGLNFGYFIFCQGTVTLNKTSVHGLTWLVISLIGSGDLVALQAASQVPAEIGWALHQVLNYQ